MKKPSEIAVTLYNLRNYVTTESELANTFKLLKAIGYSTIQVSGCGLDPKIIRKQMDEYGMYCCACHNGLDDILQPEQLCDRLDILNCDFTALGAPMGTWRSHLGMKQLAALMEKSGKVMAKRGKKLGYHNHHFEFQRLGGDQILLETFYNNCSPEYVKAEIDVHWVARGGGDPVYWINKLSDRIDVIHFKDFAVIPDADNNPKPVFCEIGNGNLNWPEIIKACRAAKVKFFSVEQDAPFPNRDIFDSIAISYNNLKKLGLK